jgi:hypothetical protein
MIAPIELGGSVITKAEAGGERDRRGRHAPGFVNSVVGAVIIIVVASLAITAQQTPPPALAELAPSAVQQLKDAPQEQTSDAGEGDGGQGAGGLGTTTTTAAADTPGGAAEASTTIPSIERARVRRCVGDPPRQTEDPQSPPCVPYWTGDNGGATYRGVTRETITLAYPALDERVAEDLMAYFNKRYEFYGRKLKIVPAGQGNVCKDRKASAVQADEEAKAFVGMAANNGNAGACFQTEMARRHLLSSASNVQFGENEMSPLAPYMWQYAMSFDKVMRAVGEMYCARMHGQNAVRAPDPLLKTKPRKLGVIMQNVLRDTDMDTSALDRALAACGAKVEEMARLSSNDDVGLTSPDKAQLAMASMKSHDITTILNLGIAFAAQSISSAADAQRYYPEWIFTTYGGFDSNTVISAFWPQASERQAIFGLTVAPPMRRWALEPAFTAMREVDPGVDPAANINQVQEFTNQYRMMLVAASGIQMAGPNLTPDTFSAALQRTTFPNPKNDPSMSGSVGFSGDHTMTDDIAEFWWSEAAKGPQGWQTAGAVGSVCYLDNGARRRLGAWPKGAGGFFEGTCTNFA